MNYDCGSLLFDMMRGTWEDIVVNVFERNCKKVPVKNFVVGNLNVLTLFNEQAQLLHLLDHSKSSSDPDVGILRQAFADSRIAQVLFHEMGKKSSLAAVVAYIEEQLNNLEFHDFLEGEKANFEQLMHLEVVQLLDAGIRYEHGKLSRSSVMTSYFDK